MLIALEGIDGAGKTLLAKRIVERALARGQVARYLERRGVPELAAGPRAQLVAVRDAIWPPQREQADDPFGTHFSLYLLAAWYSALGRNAAPSDPNVIVVVDGWYHRVIVKAFLRGGFDRAWLHSLFAHVPDPDRIVLVDIEPALSFARRTAAMATFSASEVGHWDGHRSGNLQQDFVSYQSCVRAELLAIGESRGWVHVQQRGEPPDVLVAQIEREIALVINR